METQEAIQKPQSVATAVKLLWVSFALGLLRLAIDFPSPAPDTPAWYVYFVMFFTFAVIAYLIYRISAGENWARITFLVMLLIGFLPSLPQLLNEFSRAPVAGAFSAAQIGLQVYALFLLFSPPGSGWFRRVAGRADGVD